MVAWLEGGGKGEMFEVGMMERNGVGGVDGV